MKTWLKVSTMALAAMLAISSYAADGDKPKGDGEGKRGPRGEGLFNKVDTNHDGKISKDELAAVKEERIATMLKKWDTNNDGEIDEKEIAAAKETIKKHAEEGGGRRKKGDGEEKKADAK